MSSSGVIFQDQGIENWLPLVGLTVETAKQQLRETVSISYFADSLVNGELVPVIHVLRDGDRLQFQKRFGVKGGDDRRAVEREAQGLIDAYDLTKIAAEVKRRNIPKDESIDLMAVMVDQWAVRRFGHPDAQAEKILAEILKRLDAIEARLGAINHKAVLTDTEDSILEVLGDQKMTGEQIAKKAGYPFNSNFKNTLSSMRKRGILVNDHPGYHSAKSGLSQD